MPKNNVFKEQNVFILCKLKAWIGQLLERHIKSQHNNKVKLIKTRKEIKGIHFLFLFNLFFEI